MTEAQQLRQGMLLAVAAYSLYSLFDVCVKLAGQGGYAPWQLYFITSGTAALVLVLLATLRGGIGQLKTQRLPFHIARALTNVISITASVTGITHIPLPDFYSIVFLGPILHIIMGVFMLNDRVSWRRWIAVITGLSGAIVMLPFSANYHFSGPAWAYYVCLLQPVFAAFGNILVKKYGEAENNMTFPFYTSLTIMVFACIGMMMTDFKPFAPGDLVKLVAAGTMSGIGMLCLMTSLQRVPPAYVSPFQYSQMLWGVGFGWALWHYLPSMQTVAGAALVIGSGMYLFLKKS